ncbi:LysR family transcriptional regulator [Bifidobacterium aquikefiricola]|uniref:LysR family transcriptional regulator n=1 Tax=Bifidobacterium aquikefiricola TaxID=3059038 RepID=A0AB39U8U9_9BIFI
MIQANDLSFTVLNTLIAVFETREFTAAADELQVSQSTVSKRIAGLEAVFGKALFIRRTKGELQATEAGRSLYDDATHLIQMWNATVYRMTEKNAQKTPFTLLMSHTASSTLLPRLMLGLKSRLDTTSFSIRTMNSDHIINAILNKSAHMGIIEKPVTTDLVNLNVLCEDQLVLAGDISSVSQTEHGDVNAKNVLNTTESLQQQRRASLGMETLDSSDSEKSDIWLVREPGSGVRYFTDLFLQSAGISPRNIVELDSNEKIRAVLSAGIGCTVMSQNSVPAGVAVRRLGAPFIRNFYAVTPKSGLNPAQHDIADSIISILQTRLP